MAKLLSGTRIYGTATVDTQLIVSGTAASTSTTTGALIVRGGLGIGGDLRVNGTIYAQNVSGGGSTTASAIQTILSTTSATHFLTFVDANNTTATGEILYTTSSITVNPRTGEVDILSNLSSTSTITGALVVTGGVGLGGNLNLGGTLQGISTNLELVAGNFTSTFYNTGVFELPRTLNILGTTTSISSTTGALTVSGGAGIRGDLYVGGNLNVQTGGFQVESLIGPGSNTTITAGTYTSTFYSTGSVAINSNLYVNGDFNLNGNFLINSLIGPGQDTTITAGAFTTTFFSTGTVLIPGNLIVTGTIYQNGIAVSTSTGGGSSSINTATLALELIGNGLSTSSVGFRILPQNIQSADYTLVAADSGKHILHPSSDANARTYTIPANGSVAYPIGTSITFINETTQVVTISIASDTMILAGSGLTGSRTLSQYGLATAIKTGSTTWYISGTGLT